jgi:hypothetical protein
VIPGKSERPSREVDFDGIVYQPQLDLDPIEHYLIEKGSKQTGKSISEGTGTPYDRALKNALKADDRFKLEGKSWSLVAWEAKDIRLEPSND